MAVLRHPDGEVLRRTPPRAIVGRGPRSDLRIQDSTCSTQHAEILWTGDRWVVRDLDSRNGTWIDGVRLELAEARELRVGQTLAFGNPPRPWHVHELPEPVACARAPDGMLHFAEHGSLLLPEPKRAVVTIDFDGDGRWWMEQGGTRAPCPAEAEVWIDDRPWHLMAPQLEPGTSKLQLRQSLAGARLTFHVSPDEEQVVIDALSMGMLTRLEPRAHSYLLLYLAERRLADRDSGLSADEEGWLRLEQDVAVPMGMGLKEVNVQVYRARRQLDANHIDGVARLVERRAGQLRLGVADLWVQRHREWPPPDPNSSLDETGAGNDTSSI